ncbi:NYN domain-containing protein [Kocuria sp. M1R5S2]|uniref:NYN domain-containing protein n=1 Tax=Kocuria rhizosphaerae TaxID=3376285 RepID=UPI00378B14E7
MFHPAQLAERVCAKRRNPSQLVSARVYRGRPVPERQPIPASAFDTQARVWKQDPRVIIKSRDLTYRFPYADPTQFYVQEKGIDVSLAVDLVEAAMTGAYDAMVVFSCDTDLLPALELVKRIQRVHMEIACWTGANPLWLREGLQQSPPRHFPYCHFLKEEDFVKTRETCTRNLAATMPHA